MTKTQKLTFTSILFAMAIVLAIVENFMPPLPFFIPGVKFGLSNIVVMYVLFFVGKKEAYTVAVLKSLFVFATRGAISAIVSLSGGIFSVTVMVILHIIFKEKISYFLLSVSGAIFHNLGQLVGVSIIYGSLYLFFYGPALLISGIVAGGLTAFLLKLIMPVFKRLDRE